MKKYSFVLWACLTVCPFFLQGQKVDSVRVVDPRTFPNDTTIVDTDETYGRPTGSNKRYQMKYIRKYVRQGFSGVIAVDAISGAVTFANDGLAWSKLTQAVRDSIIEGKKKVRLTSTKPGASYLADIVVDTVGLDTIYFWNTSSYIRQQLPDNVLQYENVLFVSKYGNNSTAEKNKSTRPWLTLESAVAAATSGDLIYVMKGNYSVFSNLWKNGVNWHFEDCAVGSSSVGSEYANASSCLFLATSSGTVRVTGNLRTSRLIRIDTAGVVFDGQGYELGQVYLGGGAIGARVNINTVETKSALYVAANNADPLTNNVVFYKAQRQTTSFNFMYPIAYFNNTSSRPKLNNFQIEVGSVEVGATNWGDVYNTRGWLQTRGVSAAFDSTNINVKVGQGKFAFGATWGLLAFLPYQPTTGNTIKFHCDNCDFFNSSMLSANEFKGQTTDLFVITGKYTTYSKTHPLFVARNEFQAVTKQRTIFDGQFIATDTTLFILPVSHNYEFSGYYRTDEADDRIIVADWANGTTKPTLRNVIFDSPATTPIQSSVATTWYTAGAYSTNAITKDPDITFVQLPAYDPAPTTTGTARVIPYMNTGGRLYAGNNYFKADTNTTSGGQARLRILINNPNGDIGEGDSYSSLSVRTGDALGSEAIANFGDQAVTQATTGYDAIFQTYRSGGNFTSKSNLTNGVTTGKFQFRGQVNGASRVLGNIYNVYTGDGTTINSNMFGTTAVAGSVVAGWKLDETSRFWLGANADDYYFPTTGHTFVNGRIYGLEWASTGVASVPAWKETQYAVFSGTTDASGDIAPTFAVMAGQTYAAVVTVEGTTAYQVTVHSKAQNTFKARIYDAGTGAAVGAGVNVTISYILKLP